MLQICYSFSLTTGIRFGKNRYFNDDELFDEIAELTYAEVKDFLEKYVAGPNPIPYEYFFGLAGIVLRFTIADRVKDAGWWTICS